MLPPDVRTPTPSSRRVAVRRSGAVRVPDRGPGSPAPRTPAPRPRRRRRRHGSGCRPAAAAEDLGRQDQHRDAGDQVEFPSTSRSPTPTATSATDSVVSSSSTIPERNAIRSVAMVASTVRVAELRTRAPCPRSRPSARSVGRPASRSRTWAPSRCMRRGAARTALGEPPDQPHEDRDQRQTSTGIAAETQSSPSTTSRTPGVRVAAQDSCGR